MSAAELLQHLERIQISPPERDRRLHGIRRRLLAGSCTLDAVNFTQFHPDDLRQLFDLYDEHFLNGLGRRTLGSTPLTFRISKRMTSAGGKTTRFTRKGMFEARSYEIAVASTLLFQNFREPRRPVLVTGLECRNRLEALQRIMEHELVHLMELLVWDASRCSASRFQLIARRLFGHLDYRHALMTPRQRAAEQFGLRAGSRVSFRFEGRQYTGVVNRITKRATVLVEDKSGQLFNDGRRYVRYYIPVELLRPAAK